MRRASVFLLIVTGLAVAAPARADFITVSLAPYANRRMQYYQPSSAGYPEGLVTLGGIPFNIQTAGGLNAWNAEYPGAYPHVLDIPLNIANAQEAHTLINTFYGQPEPQSYVTVEFFGTGGAYYRKDLIGNVDVRDHYHPGWTSTINGTSTVNVYSSGGDPGSESVLDKQQYLLPASFLGQTLTEFRLTSTGGVLISDATIQGLTFVTADVAVPEPGTLALCGTLGLAGAVHLALSRRRRLSSGPAKAR